MLAPAGTVPMELHVDLGPMPVDEQAGAIVEGLRGLLEKSELCDVVILGGGRSFLAHRLALAAASPSLHEYFMQLERDPAAAAADAATAAASGVLVPPGSVVLRIEDVTRSEAVQAMLDCVYGASPGKPREYRPSTHAVNREVLLLARRYRISELQEQACQWLSTGLSTANILERLVVCEEFGLGEVRDQILEQLISNPDALFVLAQDPSITKVPTVLQELLLRILRLLGADALSSQAGLGQQLLGQGAAQRENAPQAAKAKPPQAKRASG